MLASQKETLIQTKLDWFRSIVWFLTPHTSTDGLAVVVVVVSVWVSLGFCCFLSWLKTLCCGGWGGVLSLPAEVPAALRVQRRGSDGLVELRTRLSSDWNLDMIGNVRRRPSGPH